MNIWVVFGSFPLAWKSPVDQGPRWRGDRDVLVRERLGDLLRQLRGCCDPAEGVL